MPEWKVIRTQSEGAEAIAKERERQIAVEGFSDTHDDDHADGSLAEAAEAYLIKASGRDDCLVEIFWPWESKWWKPSSNPIRNLEKAGALIAAEIDRLKRLRAKEGGDAEK